MKQKILRKKIETLTIKKGEFDLSNPFQNVSTNKQKLLNNPNEIIKIRNHKINLLPTNLNYKSSSLIYSSHSPKKEYDNFSTNNFLNQNNLTKPLTLNSIITQNSIIKNNENLFNEKTNLKGNFLINKRNNNLNNNVNIKQKFSQTIPLTFRNSNDDKKLMYNNNIYIQGRKNSILSNLNSQNLTLKKLLGEEINKLKLNYSNDKFLINNNILPLSISSREQIISPRNLNKKEFNSSTTGKKNNHKILNINRNEIKLYMKNSLISSNSIFQNKKKFSKDKKEDIKNNKIFIVSKTNSISKTISHKSSIAKIQDIFINENNNNLHYKNCLSNNFNNTITTNKKKIIIEPKIFNSNDKKNKTKSIFKQEIEKKIKKEKNEFLDCEKEKKNFTQIDEKCLEKNLMEKYEISEKEKMNLIKEGSYYKQLSINLSNYIKTYYKIFKDYPLTKLSFYKFGRLIGKGAFGKVNLGLHILSGKIVAIKSFNKKKLKDENSKKKIYNEINLMKNLKHNSIVKILETIETQNYILIIMENVSGGDLLTYVKKRTKLNEKTSKFIYKQLITSLQYIHSKKIIHRDIKLDNILIDLNNNIKLCDFGVGKIYNNINDKFTDQCGTPAYIAPEILLNKSYNGPPVDIWSSGVVLYAMLSGTVPFKSNNIKDLHNIIINGSYKKIDFVSNDANNLIQKLLQVNPQKRISIQEILNHPWICSDNNCEDNNINHINKNFSLFTKSEIILLSKENLDYRNCDKNEIIENFTLKNLYTINDKENKDIFTKSNILAPFSSSIDSKNLNDKSALLNSEIEVENENLNFNENANILNRQYELNNNGEIDHGILINHLEEKEENKKENNIKEEIFNNNENYQFENTLLKNIKSAPENNNYMKYYKENSKRNNSSLTNSSTLVDENIIKIMENFGYKRDYIYKCLYNNELNYATATFFLLSNNVNDFE